MTKKLKTFIVTTSAIAEWQFEVKAYDRSEVENKFYDGDYKELNKGLPTNIINEQVNRYDEKIWLGDLFNMIGGYIYDFRWIPNFFF